LALSVTGPERLDGNEKKTEVYNVNPVKAYEFGFKLRYRKNGLTFIPKYSASERRLLLFNTRETLDNRFGDKRADTTKFYGRVQHLGRG